MARPTAIRSSLPPRRAAASEPRGTPISKANDNPIALSTTETGKRCLISLPTDWLVNIEVPRLPCTTWVTQAPYWLGSEAFRW